MQPTGGIPLREPVVHYISVSTSTNDLVESFLDAKFAAGRSVRTIEAYRQRLGYFTTWLHTREITRVTLRGYLKHLQEQELSDTTRASYFRDVSVFCNWLVDERVWDSNPAYKLALRVPKLMPANYSTEQIARLLLVCDLRDRAAILILLDTGIRAGELCSLRRDSVDQAGVFVVHGKGNKDRRVFLSCPAREALAEYVTTRRDASPWLWPNRYGEPITRNGLYQAIRRAAVRSGIRDETRRLVHAMRITFARSYIQEGGDLSSLAALLGHSSLTMTQHYAQLDDDELGELKARINPLGRALRDVA